MGRLTGKVALITGGNKGIGKGIARGLAKEGARLTLTGRDAEALEKTKQELSATGADVLTITSDVKDESQIKAAFALSMETYGRLDILVNNAGAFDGGPFDQLSTEAWDHVIAVNLRGPFLCAREAFGLMKKQGGGRIINIGSISAQRVRFNSAPYSASKHGLWGLTQVIALEGREHNITCGCLHPGNVEVERRAASTETEDQEPMMSVDSIAEVAVLMACLPDDVNLLEAIALPKDQLYIGRG